MLPPEVLVKCSSLQALSSWTNNACESFLSKLNRMFYDGQIQLFIVIHLGVQTYYFKKF